MEALISEIQIYEDRKPNGQWLKSIKFRLPIIEERNVSFSSVANIPAFSVTGRVFPKSISPAFVREVLSNSFAHAIYNARTNHEICIYPGMITIYSPGEYASKYKPEEYIKDNIESEIRNAFDLLL